MHRIPLFFATIAVLVSATAVFGQDAAQALSAPRPPLMEAYLPDAPQAADSSSQAQSPNQAQLPSQDRNPPQPPPSREGKQTKRILGIIPNFRSVSVDEKLPPIATHDKFKLMLEDSFDYSNFIYVGVLSGIGQAENSYPEFHTGAAAYARYYWHSFADTLDGNMMTEFVFPTVTHEDPRYYTLGRGGFGRRAVYSVGRLVITRSDKGGAVPNISEIVGNGAAAGIAGLYYPSQERTWTKTGQRWITQVSLDGVANMIKEFWPDINNKLFHGHY